ncbi:MAG TPA: hypothetical protein VL484_13120 [Vicinamibacterales bacterium]|nr:hypothetical protein [Vicinamibacterales bacterium]
MDPRFERIFAEQRRARFRGLSGSEYGGTIRISDRLLNQCIEMALPPDGVVRAVSVRSREGNWLDAKVTLSRPSFLPPISVEFAIDRQPTLPHDPVLALRLTGGAGSLLKLATSTFRTAMPMPAGVRLDGDRVLVDIRAVLQARGQTALLDFVQQLCVTTEEAGVAVILLGRVP